MFDCIDTGKGRRGGDILFMEGHSPKIANILATAANYALAYERGTAPSRTSHPNHLIKTFVADHPALVASAHYLASQPRTAPIPPSSGTFLHFEMSKGDSALADDFIRKLYTGADLSQEDILLELHNRFLNARLQGKPYPMLTALFMCAKVWNSLRRGKPIKHIGSAVCLGDDTAFPTLL